MHAGPWFGSGMLVVVYIVVEETIASMETISFDSVSLNGCLPFAISGAVVVVALCNAKEFKNYRRGGTKFQFVIPS